VTKKRIPDLAFWPLVCVGALAVGAAVAYAFFLFMGRIVGSTSLNFWGDAEGLVVQVWLVFGIAVAVCLFVVARLRAVSTRERFIRLGEGKRLMVGLIVGFILWEVGNYLLRSTQVPPWASVVQTSASFFVGIWLVERLWIGLAGGGTETSSADR
jgi:hypothetical protein